MCLLMLSITHGSKTSIAVCARPIYATGVGEVLRTGLATNARAIHLRNIRAVFNKAIDEEVIGLELYPFRRFKIEKERTRKRAVSLAQLRVLFDYPC